MFNSKPFKVVFSGIDLRFATGDFTILFSEDAIYTFVRCFLQSKLMTAPSPLYSKQIRRFDCISSCGPAAGVVTCLKTYL